MRKQAIEKFVLLFLPFLLALIFQSDPIISYFIAWLGSFFIFFLSLSGWLTPIPDDLTLAEQLMRPLFLVQIIFAGYMACSSIFYFSSLFGYANFKRAADAFIVVDTDEVKLTAECQRYYVLGHGAFVAGIAAFMKYPIKQKFFISKDKIANLLFVIAFVTLPVSLIFLNYETLKQFYFQLSSLSFIAGTLALAFAIPLRKVLNTIFCLVLYFSNFYQALLSGFKEPIILSVLVLGIFLYPHYKKLVFITFIPALLLLFTLLPTFNTAFRQSNWADNASADDAYKVAIDATLGDNEYSKDDNTWSFLVYRVSEINMFTNYIQSTPKYIDYYGLTLLKQSAIAIIPRVFWESKPLTEELVMQRVYDAGVAAKGSNVSAKPAVVVDGYLSGGMVGIIITLFIYGAAAQLISMQAERLFGGYTLGTALIFSGLFQVFWRGESFEFLINSVFWSYATMYVIFALLRAFGLLRKIDDIETA